MDFDDGGFDGGDHGHGGNKWLWDAADTADALTDGSKNAPLSKTARYILGSLGGLAAIDGARRIYCALSSSKEADKPIDLGSVVVGGVEVIGGGFAAYEMFKNPASAAKSIAK